MTERTNEPLKAGDVFYVTSGAYSDYYVLGVWRAKSEITREMILATGQSTSGAMTALASQGLIEEIEAREVWFDYDFKSGLPIVEL